MTRSLSQLKRSIHENKIKEEQEKIAKKEAKVKK